MAVSISSFFKAFGDPASGADFSGRSRNGGRRPAMQNIPRSAMRMNDAGQTHRGQEHDTLVRIRSALYSERQV